MWNQVGSSEPWYIGGNKDLRWFSDQELSFLEIPLLILNFDFLRECWYPLKCYKLTGRYRTVKNSPVLQIICSRHNSKHENVTKLFSTQIQDTKGEKSVCLLSSFTKSCLILVNRITMKHKSYFWQKVMLAWAQKTKF